ncbi:MAG: hypothetical protein ACR2LF_00055 [Jatrophihabitantaceae bacterium]
MTAHEFETALARAEDDATKAAATANLVLREVKRARQAAVSGQVRELRRAFDAAAELARDLQAAIEAARNDYDIDEAELLSSGAYAKELLAVAGDSGVAMFEEDDRLLCYPSIVRVLAGELAVEIDRKRVRALRPSAVVAQLERAQQRGAKFKPEPLLASLLKAYDLLVAQQHKVPGAVVRLVDVYAVLTMLPGQAREYSKPEFARDLYLLDQNGAVMVAGRRLHWAASTGTRQAGVLSTVAKSGQQQRYWGIAFAESSS